MHFTVFDTDGVTPLTGQAGSCTSSLRKNGATTAESVTIGEIGSTGRYYASFTPTAISNYDLEVTCPDDRVVGENWETEAVDLDDLKTEIDANETKIDDILADTDTLEVDLETYMDGKFSTTDGLITTLDGVVDLIKPETDKIQAIDDNVDAILLDTDTIEADLKTYMDTKETNIIAEVDANEAKLDIIQTDLDNPTQYMADVSALAIEANVEGHVTTALNTYDPPTRAELTSDINSVITEVDANETKLDTVITHLTDIKGAGWVDENLRTIDIVVDAIQAITDNLPDSGALTTIQADLDNPNQYKADVTALAIEANVETHVTNSLNSYDPPTRAELTSDIDSVITEVDANETKIDAIDTIVTAIQTVTDLLPDAGALTTIITHLTDIKGAGWVDENITTIDALLDLVKAKTDNLPVNTSSELDAIDTAIAAVPTVGEIDTELTNNHGSGDWITGSGLSEAELHTGLDNYTNKDNWKANITAIATHLTDIKGVGWIDENLVTIDANIDAIGAGGGGGGTGPAVGVPFSTTFPIFNITTGALEPGILPSEFTATLYDPTDTEVGGVTFKEFAGGLYEATFTADATGRWSLSIYHATHLDTGYHYSYTAEQDQSTIRDEIESVNDKMYRVLGLVQENQVIETLTKTATGKMLTGVKYLYDDDPSTGNITDTYDIEVEYDVNDQAVKFTSTKRV